MPFHHAIDGTRIHFREYGEGQTVLLIPGLGGDGNFWAGVERILSRTYHLIVVDHRGAGASDRPAGPYSITAIAQDTLGILSDVGVDKVNIVGHSTGGMIAQTIVTTEPERVDKLILSGTWDRTDRRFRDLFDARAALLRHSGAVAYQKLTHALGYDPDWIEQNAEMLDAEILSADTRLAPLDVQLSRLAMLLEHDCLEHLPFVDKPTLIVGAQDDAVIPFRYSERLSELIPRARLIAMTGGHFYPRSYPEPFARTVLSFLDETS